MKKLFVIIPIIQVFFSNSCTTNNAEIKNQQKDITANEILITLRENTLEKYDSIQLINTAEEYYKITNIINSIRMPGIDFKEVDFRSNSVVLINMLTDNYSDFEIYPKTKNETTTVFYSGIYYEENQMPFKNIRLVKLIEIPKTKKIESFRPMH